MRAPAAGLLFAALLLSACVGDPQARSAPSSAAPPPAVDEATGSITGVVFDAEQVPLAQVLVGVGDGLATSTDASGRFTFNGLRPGGYTLRFGRDGYANLTRSVDVAPQTVTEIRVQLEASLADVAYHWSFSKVGLVRLGQWTLQYGQHTVNHSALDALLCDPCAYPVTLRPEIVDAVTDVQYTRAVGLPLVNEYVTIAYTTAQGSGAQLKLLMTHDFGPRASWLWTPGQVRELRGNEEVRLEFHGPDTDPPGVLVNQRVELWQTFAHGQRLPPGYTLLPQ